MTRLTLTKESKTDILTDQQISDLVDQFLGNELAKSRDGTLTQEQLIGIASEELRLKLEALEMNEQRGKH